MFVCPCGRQVGSGLEMAHGTPPEAESQGRVGVPLTGMVSEHLSAVCLAVTDALVRTALSPYLV